MLGSIIDSLSSSAYSAIDKGLIPDVLLRPAIRSLLRLRLKDLYAGSASDRHERKIRFVEGLREKPVAIEQDKANEQHYEVSTEFIQSTLGPRMKYSSCLFPTGKESLAEAETAMLDLYASRAGLVDGQDVMDLGCGWGSLCLYVVERYPNSRVVALSNSSTQKVYIDGKAKELGVASRLKVVTGDVKEWTTGSKFDRIVSIEMLEHMKNYEFLFRKISSWLKDDGQFFCHIFCHKSDPYHFEDSDGWMAQMFFSGGTMPSHDLFAYFQSDLVLRRSWYLPGTHYAQTLESWLKLQDAASHRWLKRGRSGLEGMLDGVGNGHDLKLEGGEGKDVVAERTFYRFRVFYMACAELFAFDGGETWGVGHYLFHKRSTATPKSSSSS